VAFINNVKRTATVQTKNYVTLGKIDAKTFRDMCKNFPIVEKQLKDSFVNYKDKYKVFIKKML